MILDTSFLIDLMKNKQAALTKAQSLEYASFPVRTTTITVFELWQGLEDLQDEQKRTTLEHFLSGIGLLGFDLESAKQAGKIHAELRRKGEIIDAEDSMIAGIAQQHNEAVLTRNVKHFERIRGLKIEKY
ncbi:type II toxin-antitoxin system VapC family toxin [Candidatus Woesearchaeota archaeon]|nr:type II toxin-antitoxin system VapC family toxin [Candidatus Woesearchaeota archaeon]